MKRQIVPVKVYVAVFVALIVLLLGTFATDFVDLGGFNVLINLTIAVLKALLVVLFFMHIRYTSNRVVRVYVGAGFFWLLILIVYTLGDVLTRAASTYTP
ncbi:MAG TPA: cytochrome C oxidase subunit IV family protein [Verrucomicrobiae bacterium]|nr:cytochrome C oxidase subunit IV family protein [Verrucomicrobiae bacterium]